MNLVARIITTFLVTGCALGQPKLEKGLFNLGYGYTGSQKAALFVYMAGQVKKRRYTIGAEGDFRIEVDGEEFLQKLNSGSFSKNLLTQADTNGDKQISDDEGKEYNAEAIFWSTVKY